MGSKQKYYLIQTNDKGDNNSIKASIESAVSSLLSKVFKMKLGINGFGRIGRLAMRVALANPEIEIVAINDLLETDYMAYLLSHDSSHGRYPGDVSFDANGLIVDGKHIKVQSKRDPHELDWTGVDVVIECTGLFLTQADAQAHIDAGARKVVMSAPAKDDTPTFVMGVNHHLLKADQHIISNASCTTNCLARFA